MPTWTWKPRGLVNDAVEDINGNTEFSSVGAWWWGLDCRLRRVATGDGNTEDAESPYCADYPGSGRTPLLGDVEKARVDMVGQALLGRTDPGVYPRDIPPFMGWWNALEPAQRVAALHGDSASPEQSAAAEPCTAIWTRRPRGWFTRRPPRSPAPPVRAASAPGGNASTAA